MNTDLAESRLAAVEGGQTLCAAVAEELGTGPATVDDLERAVRVLADQPGAVASWLTDLCRNAAIVRELAQRSYWHPNGFAKLVLHVNEDPEFRIRLHVWPVVSAEPLLGESNPHSHRWDFASTLIAGGLHSVEYVETEHCGKPYDRYRFGADPNDRAALSRDGSTRLKRVRTTHVMRGQVYSCDTSVVHTVAPVEAGLTATLLVQGPHRSSSTVVYCLSGTDEDQPNGAMSESDFLLLVKSVVAELRGAAGR